MTTTKNRFGDGTTQSPLNNPVNGQAGLQGKQRIFANNHTPNALSRHKDASLEFLLDGVWSKATRLLAGYRLLPIGRNWRVDQVRNPTSHSGQSNHVKKASFRLLDFKPKGHGLFEPSPMAVAPVLAEAPRVEASSSGVAVVEQSLSSIAGPGRLFCPFPGTRRAAHVVPRQCQTQTKRSPADRNCGWLKVRPKSGYGNPKGQRAKKVETHFECQLRMYCV